MKAAYKLRMRILANSLGDTLYPVWDDAGDMALFGRGYILVNDAGEKVEYMDVFTPTKIIKASKAQAGWLVTEEANTVGKIPVIYYKQALVEWADVQPMIERLETKLSNHSDTNDYFDSPVLFIEGDPVSMPEKEEMGKMIKGEPGSKAYYVTWNQAPESTRMEIENLWRFIHNCTDTPDISFEAMKTLGNAPSGYAIELMFLSAHLKAADKEENFGESVQRRINYIKAWLGVMDASQAKYNYMPVKPKFEYFLPENITEKIDLLNAAVAGGIMASETAIRSNPLVDDPDNELELLKADQGGQLDALMGGVVKPITTNTGGSAGQVPSAATGKPTGKI
jgi:SPP1 family phage portal protein